MAVVDGNVIVDTSTISWDRREDEHDRSAARGAVLRGAGMIASTNYAAVTLIAAGGALMVGIVVVLVLRHRAKGTRAEIPAGMRPGPSDQALETPLLLKLQGWGVVLVTFFVLWFPVMWLVEPGTNLTQEQALDTDAIARGHLATQPFSEDNQLGVGCVRCHGNELRAA
jgi:hypothetical protein